MWVCEKNSKIVKVIKNSKAVVHELSCFSCKIIKKHMCLYIYIYHQSCLFIDKNGVMTGVSYGFIIWICCKSIRKGTMLLSVFFLSIMTQNKSYTKNHTLFLYLYIFSVNIISMIINQYWLFKYKWLGQMIGT